ncbi:MAG: DUF58 domain-containing protein [Terriglobales bacterium]
MLQKIQVALSKLDRGAWLRFFLALFGLAFAFLAAVYSTVFRESGNLLGTAIAASVALVLAALVGIATVPYLAKRVGFRRMREAFDYEATREGAAYIVLIIVLGIAALNTNNNLLFIIVSAMLGAIGISGVCSWMMMREMQLEISLPQHVFAKRSVVGRVTLRNQRRWIPSFSMRVVNPKKVKHEASLRWEKSVFAFPSKRPVREQWVRVPDLALRRVPPPPELPGIFSGAVYFPFVKAGSSASADVELNFPKRGRHVQEGLGLSTRFPFSFLTKTRRVPLERELVVYPSVDPTEDFFDVLPLIAGEFEAFVRGRGYDLYRIREYLPEDSARNVDWKATAKTGALKVREFTREDERKLRIVFDNPASGTVSDQAYESGVQMAASLAWHFSQQDAELNFAAAGIEDSEDVYDFLAYLALVSPASAGSDVLRQLPASDAYNIILTAQPRGSLPTELWAKSYFVFIAEA